MSTLEPTNPQSGDLGLRQKKHRDPLNAKFKTHGQSNIALDQLSSRQTLDSELLKVTTASFPELVARENYRKLVMASAKSLGVCHVTKENQRWRILPEGSTGRVPKSLDLESITTACEEAFATNTAKVLTLSSLDDLTGVLAPVPVNGQPPELLLVVTKPASDLKNTLEVLQHVVGALKLRLSLKSAESAGWQASSLAAIMELVGKIETSDHLQASAEEVVNSLLQQLGANTAALAIRRKRGLKLRAVSGTQKLDRSSQTSRDYLQILSESTVREDQAICPPVDLNNEHLLVAHKQAIATLQEEAIISQPLVTSHGQVIGAWCFAGTQAAISHPHVSRFVAAASPHVADALQLLGRAERPRLSRIASSLRKSTSRLTRWMVPVAVGGLILAMWIPVTYRVRCNAAIEPAARRFAVAPFDGLITAGFAEPGDVVREGQVLAEIDGRSIRWELSGVTAERRQSLRQREIELNERNIPKAFLAELENERLTAEENILNFKRENLQIKSPIDGIVLSGSLERAEAASVQTGQVLFEVGSVDPIKIQVAIPAEDIAQVQIGHPVTIWIEGQEDAPLKSTIAKIHPRSEIRDARNVFVAEVEFPNPQETFRPGMKGSVRIDGEKRSLGWTLFHKPLNYLRSRFTYF